MRAESKFQLRLHKFSIRARLFSIVLAFAVPLLVLIYFTIENINRNIDIAKKEMVGTQYERNLVNLLAGIGEHRLAKLENNLSGGHTEKIEKLLSEFEKTNKKYKFTFQLDMEKLRENWKFIKNSPSDDYVHHAEMLQTISEMIVKVGDDSGLILDPDLDSYYLMAISVNHLPRTILHISDAAFSLYPQLVLSEKVSSEFRGEAKVSERFIRDIYFKKVLASIGSIFKEDKNFYGVSKSLEKELKPVVSDYTTKMEDLQSMLRSIYLGNTISALEFVNKISDIRSFLADMSHKTLQELDVMLEARIEFYEQRKIYILFWYAVAQLVGLGLFLFLTTSVTTPINHLYKAIVAITEGKLDTHVPNQPFQDEIGQISRSVESFRLNAVEKLRLERERKAMEAELLDHRDHLQELVEIQTASLVIAKEKAEKATIAKSEFMSNMSHELRTPMHAILNYADMGQRLVEGESPEKLNKYLGNIKTAGNRLLGLLNNLLDFEKLEVGKMEFQIKQNNFIEAVEKAEIELDSLLKANNLQLAKSYSCTNTVIDFDEAKIIQVIVNLISNAIKFSPENSTITINVADEFLPEKGGVKAALLCMVADEGVGIPEDELETVFDQFTQSSKTKTTAGGTGLGLSISRKIIEGHNGRIWAENGEERGAVIKFVLPRG